MKKLLFIFFTLTIFANVSYASFPVSDTLKVKQDTLQTEEIKQYHYSLQQMGIDLKSCKCESCRHGVTPLVSKSNILSKKKEIEIQKEKTGKITHTTTKKLLMFQLIHFSHHYISVPLTFFLLLY